MAVRPVETNKRRDIVDMDVLRQTQNGWDYCSVKKVSTTLPLSLTRQTKRFGLSVFSR